MSVSLRTDILDSMLRFWNGAGSAALVKRPVFGLAKAHASDLQGKALSDEEYLYALMHIGGVDIKRHQEEIARNANILSKIDLEMVAESVDRYLPEEAQLNKQSAEVYLFPGCEGLALSGMVLFDPAPLPWFPEDGSDAEAYAERFAVPTLQHELHHLGFQRLRGSQIIGSLESKGELYRSYFTQLQMEGSAMVCQKQGRSLRRMDEKLLLRIADELFAWKARADEPVTDEDKTFYQQLWGEEQIAYVLGEMLFGKGLSAGLSVAQTVAIAPEQWFERLIRKGLLHNPCGEEASFPATATLSADFAENLRFSGRKI